LYIIYTHFGDPKISQLDSTIEDATQA